MSSSARNEVVGQRIIKSPAGDFIVRLHADGAVTGGWVGLDDGVAGGERRGGLDRTILPDVADRLERYFAGEGGIDFSDVPTPRGPEFHVACWKACRRIPVGQTRSYAELAKMAGGSASAARAAGQAMR